MEVDDPIAISMAIDEKLIVIDRSLNDNQQEPYEVKHVVREKGKEKQKNDDDRKHATEKNIEVNANEGVQAVNVNVNISIEKEGNATNEKGNLSLATSNKKEILNDDKSDVAKKNNKKEKDDEKKEYKESCATGDEKLKPNLRRKLSRRSSASPFKQLEQQEGEGQRSPESIEDNGDLKLVVEEEEEDEDSDGVTTMKRKRHNVRKSGSDEYLLGFDEQSGEAELIKMEIDGEEVNAISSGILSEDIDVSPSTFKLNKVSTGLTTPEKQSESDTEIKQGEHGNKFINSHIVGDNEDAGIINKKSFPQTRNSKIGGTVPKSSTLMSVPGTSGGQAAKRPPQSDYYKKPFKYGWKRELVWRANLETSKDKADVYFISPAGKKLRARSDIIPLLEGDLTIEHFCFAREPLGVGPDLEIVRSAKPSSRTTVTAATLAAAASPTNIGKRISKPKGPKGASPPPQGWTPSQALKVNNAALLSSTNAAHRHSSSYQYHYQHQVSSTASSAALSPSSRRGQNSEAQSHHHQQSISHTSTPMSMSSHSVSSTGSGSGSSANKSSSKLKKQANDIENDLKQINESIRQHRKHSFEMGKITTMPASGALSVTAAINSNSKNNNSNSTNAITTSQELQHINKMFVSNFFANISYAYSSLLNILKYLKIHERSRAASVCKLWNLAAKDTSLWHTVRMKNSKVCSWSGFVAALRRGETKHLDLRKMLVSNTRNEEFWLDFSQCIGTVCSLEIIDLCRCSARVVESLFLSNSNLKILNAMAINDDTLNLDNIYNLQNLKELRLRPCELLTLAGDLMPLATLTQLTHLSLTAIRGLGGKCIEILSELSELKSLELGECGDFERQFADEVLPKLLKLQRLRLENGQQTNCCTLAILDGLAQLPQLEQLELVNFDIKTGFDEKLRLCRHLTKLMIIPTYISQSATTNRIVLSAVQQVADTLKCFTWVVTIELLRVTALYVDQCEESTKKEKHHFDECIPVLKPVPGAPVTINDDDDVDNVDEKYNGKKKTTNALISSNKDLDGSTEAKIKSRESKGDDDVDASMTDGGEVPQIEILPLDKVEMILAENLPQTKFTIVKVPYHQTSKQHLVE